MKREVEGPDREWLSDKEAWSWLNIPEGTFDSLVEQGVIPPGRVWSKKAVRWHWLTLVAVSHLIAIGHIRLEEEQGGGTK